VLAADQSRADVDRPDQDLVDAQVVETEHRADDVGDGVGCSHLVEVHPLRVDAVDLRFGLGEAEEDVHRPPFDLLREAARLDERHDVLEVAVLVLCRVVHHDASGADAVAPLGGAAEAQTLDPQGIQRALKLFQREADVDQSTEQHIAADAAEGVDVRGGHRPASG
jgi:hypothetical protein